MRRLLLTDRLDINKTDDILLGPWCLKNIPESLGTFDQYNIEPDPFKTPENLRDSSTMSISYMYEILPKVVAMLNDINHTSHTKEFWRIMATPWLLTLIQIAFERQERIKNVIDKYGDEEISVELIENNVSWNFKDSLEFFNSGVIDSLFNEWLFSRILEQNIPQKWSIKYINKIDCRSHSVGRNKYYTLSFKDYLKNILLCRGVYGFKTYDSILFSIILFFKPKTNLTHLKEEAYVSTDLSKVVWSFNIEELISITIPHSMKQVKKQSYEKLSNQYVWLIGPLLNWNDKEKYHFAQKVENGGKLIITQHGGNYGNAMAYNFPGEIEYKQYKFFSWGWKAQANYAKNILPMPSPFLSNFKYNMHKTNTSILLIGTKEYLFSYRLSSVPQPLQRLESITLKELFLKNVNEKIYANMIYVPNKDSNNAFNVSKYISLTSPNLQITSMDLHKLMTDCRLIILDHPGTTMNISMAKNIPMIGIWSEASWALCEQAIPYFEKLKQAGIIFHDGKKAAEALNERFNNIEKWWYSEDVQQARKQWIKEYALNTKKWRRIWIKKMITI